MTEYNLVFNKKVKRAEKGLCVNCGKMPCLCRVPKSVARRVNWKTDLPMPVGINRRGGKER